MTYRFTAGKNWFDSSELKMQAHLHISTNSVNQILEIGSYEGISSVFFADNFLGHPLSSLTLVDPFTSINDNDHGILLDSETNEVSPQEANFLYNISKCSYPQKLRFSRTTSDKFLPHNPSAFNFIYLDGNHTSEQISRDICNCFSCLSTGGILWMDDYLGGVNNCLKATFDESIKLLHNRIAIIHEGYQIAIRKLY
jgi:hypothetical protein